MKPSVILVDGKADNEFFLIKNLRKTCNGGGWNVFYDNSCKLHKGAKNIIRYIRYFLFAFKMLFWRKRFAKMVAWQQFYGIIFAAYCKFFRLKHMNELTILTFIFKEKKGFLGKIFYYFVRYSISSEYVDKIICFSKNEPDYYSRLFNASINKFYYVLYGLCDIKNINISKGDYIFTTGRSNRDFDFLIECVKDTNYKLIIASNIYKNNNLPVNVQILDNCFGFDMINCMANCKFVAIPLKNTEISSGQLVVLRALSLRKPVFCTESNGISDYVSSEQTGFLLINNVDIWRKKFKLLYENSELYNRMCENARNSFVENFSEDRMADNVANIVAE